MVRSASLCWCFLAGFFTMLLLLTMLIAPCWATDDDKARELFIVGRDMFNDGRLEEAINNWEQSYALSARTLIQFNLAEAYERVGRFQEALDALILYQPDAADDEADRIAARISSLRTRVSIEDNERKAAEAERRRREAELDAERRRTEELSKQVNRHKGSPVLLPLVVSGVGLGLVGAGIVSGIGTTATRKKLADPALCTAQGVCKQPAQALTQQQQRGALVTDVLVFSGVAVTAAGSALLVLQLLQPKHPPSTAVWLAPVPSGAVFGVQHAF